MKHQKSLFFKTLVSLLLASAVLSSGMLLIAASDETSEPLENEVMTPDVSEIIEDSNEQTVDTPTTIEGEFGEYSFVTEEDGKSVVTIYSAEQIAGFVSRYENGEWICLTAEEVMFLVNDTIAMFDKYDTIRILGLDGKTNTYYGKNWYASEEYLSHFGGIVTEETDASFNLRLDVGSALLARLRVLTNAINEDINTTVVYTDIPAPIEQWKLDGLNMYMFDLSLKMDEFDSAVWHGAYSPYGALMFYQQSVYFADDLSTAREAKEIVLPVLKNGELISQKYDTGDDTVVVIEVWEEASRSIVARLRLTSTDDAEEVAKISALWSEVMYSREAIDAEDHDMLTDYRVAVYINGVEMMYGDPSDPYASGYSRGFRYNPDGNLDVWGITCGGGADEAFDWYFCGGSQELAAYVNSILKARLLGE